MSVTCTVALVTIENKMAVPSQPVDGFYFDELSKIRVLDPSTANSTENLRDECKDFVDSKSIW